MGLFGLFNKKNCSICGGEIGLLGNRKLEDGNLCKACAKKLSPWFSDRRKSTVDQIREQLKYREENQAAVAAFHTTVSLGDFWKLLVDEDANKFLVTRGSNLAAENPDVLDFSQITGVEFNINEDQDEVLDERPNGESVSFSPPRYNYSYDFEIVIRVNHPYFDEMRFQLNGSSVCTTHSAVIAVRKPDPHRSSAYTKYEEMGDEIVSLLREGRRHTREAAAAAAAPKAARVCPACGASTTPGADGRCEFCGTPLV